MAKRHYGCKDTINFPQADFTPFVLAKLFQ